MRKRLVVLVLVMGGALGLLIANASQALADTACPAGSDTWYGPGGNATLATSGNWLTASNWSTGAIPDSNCQALITVPGTYTVTIQPTDIGTDDPDNYGVYVGSLVIGAPTGSQTVDVSGQSSIYNGETYNVTYLSFVNASTINPTGTLLLDSTAGGSTAGGGCCSGGAAQITGYATLQNYGTIDVQSEDTNPSPPPGIQPTDGAFLTNEVGGSVNLISGPVTFDLANEGLVTNDGTFAVDAAASLIVGGNSGTSDAFTNDGSIVDNGSITDGGATWNQSGGSISGNAVAIGNNALLNDSGGTGQFQLTPGQTYVNGTIPSGQTVTVEPGVTLNDFVNNDLLVNDGTVVFEGNPPSAGQPSTLYGGGLTNNGALDFDVTSPSDVSELNSTNVTNTATGTVDVGGGTLISTSNGTTANSGTMTVAPGALWTLNENAELVNTAAGTIVPEIASATSVGTFQVTSPCCNGPGSITAAGTLAPELVGGFTPTANEEFQVFLLDGGAFTGTFSTVGSDFTADYSQEGSSPAYVGVVYQAAAPPSPPTAMITTPAGGASYQYGSVPDAAFSCTDGTGGTGIASCTATVDGTPIGNGGALPGSLGPHTITVTATSKDGLSGEQTASYTVIQATTRLSAEPQLIFTKPVSGAGLFSVNATLLTSAGAPVVGATITFTSGKTAVCTAVTTGTGDASCTIKLLPEIIVLVRDSYTASYAGSDDDAAATATTRAYEKAPAGARVEETLTKDGKRDTHRERFSLARAKRLKPGRYSLTVTVAGHPVITRSTRIH
jgi:surface antigen